LLICDIIVLHVGSGPNPSKVEKVFFDRVEDAGFVHLIANTAGIVTHPSPD
jgi:hypothetical protein